MTVTHTIPSTPRIRTLPRSADRNAGVKPGLAVAVVLFLAVLIVDAVIIVSSAPSASDLGSLYLITT
jgi:hypothetical protein